MVFVVFMGRSLEFGIETNSHSTTISISGSSGPLRIAGRRRPEVKAAEEHKLFRYIETKPGTKASQDLGEVSVNARKATGINNKQERRAALRGVLNYLHFLGSGKAEWMDVDPRLQLHDGILDPSAANNGLAATVRTPDMTDPGTLERTIERGMKGMAKDLGYGGKPGTPVKRVERTLSGIIDASIDPSEGFVLSADSNNGASLATGEDYDPESGFMQFYSGREFTNPAQQLICLAGVIEIAQAGQQQLAKA